MIIIFTNIKRIIVDAKIAVVLDKKFLMLNFLANYGT